jgi:hypothetical protein
MYSSDSWAVSNGKWKKYERLIVHNILYIFCLSYIYYEYDIRDSIV